MWDQLIRAFVRCYAVRIIPTYVGSTFVAGTASTCTPNHSHVCGINSYSVKQSVTQDESFPRMWDQPQAIVANPFLNRIIPTYVGSTLPRTVSGRLIPNHSHVCGINYLGDMEVPADKRIIPTYVGSTFRILSPFPFPSNHSHVCGINPIQPQFIEVKSESFPRMWDQLIRWYIILDLNRIIPTYVGSTETGHMTINPDAESFPRMWDQHLQKLILNASLRIIPTYVGSTPSALRGTRIRPNHSHVCGINAATF